MRVTGAKCGDCGKVAGGGGNWSSVWRALKDVGWTVDRGKHRCPACTAAWRRRLDEEAKAAPLAVGRTGGRGRRTVRGTKGEKA